MAEHVYRLQIGFVSSNKNFGINVFYYQFDDAGYPTSYDAAKDLVNNFESNNIPSITPMIGSDSTINIITARRVTGGGGTSFSKIGIHNGTNAQTTFSAALAACVKWVVGDPDNRTGRTFIGCVPVGGIVADTFGGAYSILVGNFIAQMLTTIPLGVGLINATFGKWDKKTATFWPALSGGLNPKASGFNKRTLPVT